MTLDLDNDVAMAEHALTGAPMITLEHATWPSMRRRMNELELVAAIERLQAALKLVQRPSV